MFHVLVSLVHERPAEDMNHVHAITHADSSDSVNVIHVLNRSFANEGRQDVNHICAVIHS